MADNLNPEYTELLNLIQQVLDIEKRLKQTPKPTQSILTKRASELKKGDICIIKNKIYKITAIWVVPTLTKNASFHKLSFVLYCDDDKSKIETIYHVSSLLIIDENGYIKMD